MNRAAALVALGLAAVGGSAWAAAGGPHAPASQDEAGPLVVRVVAAAGVVPERSRAVLVCGQGQGRHTRRLRPTGSGVRIRPPRGGSCAVWASAADLGFARGEVGGGEVALRLGAGATLVLTVSDEPTGRAIRGDSVVLRLAWKPDLRTPSRAVPPEVLSRRTSPRGGLAVGSLAAGTYEVEVAAEGYASRRIMVRDLRPGQLVRRDVALPRSAAISGFLAGRDPGSDVRLRCWRSDTLERRTVVVAPDGSFRLDDLESGVAYGFTTLRQGIESEPVYAVAPAAGVAVEVAGGRFLRGRVTSDAGPPRPIRVEVTVGHPPLPDLHFPPLREETVDDPQGRFAIELPHGVELEVRFSAAGYAPAVVRVGTGPVLDEVEVELCRGAELSGRVRSAIAGDPVAGARVSLQCLDGEAEVFADSVSSDRDGAFRFSAVPPEACSLRVWSDGFSPLDDVVEVTEDDVHLEHDVDLEPEAVLRGRVVIGPDEVPAAGARVAISYPRVPGSPRAVAGADGRFELRGLPPGQVAMEIAHPSGFLSAAGLAERGDPEPRIYRLQPTVTSRGQVLAMGEPLAGARLTLFGGRRTLRTETGPDGSFVLGGVPVGAVRWDVSHPRLVQLCSGVRQVSAAAPDLDIACGRGFRLTFTGVAGDAALQLRDLDRGRLYRPSRRGGGRAVFVEVPDGAYELFVPVPLAEDPVLWRGRVTGAMVVSLAPPPPG